MRPFLFIDQNGHDDEWAAGIDARERELASYDRNIESYTSQVASMKDVPKDWPPEVVRFRGMTNEDIKRAGATDEEASLASQLNHRDRVELLLFTEKAEMRKSEAAYTAQLEQLTDTSRRNGAVARHKAKPKP